jgi:uncharacterized DUF497 family protein
VENRWEWDPDKAKQNRQKHGVDFADAIGVFYDEQAIWAEDEDSEEEQRFRKIGTDFLGRLLVVIYTYRGEKIRLISARKATKKETGQYYA